MLSVTRKHSMCVLKVVYVVGKEGEQGGIEAWFEAR